MGGRGQQAPPADLQPRQGSTLHLARPQVDGEFPESIEVRVVYGQRCVSVWVSNVAEDRVYSYVVGVETGMLMMIMMYADGHNGREGSRGRRVRV